MSEFIYTFVPQAGKERPPKKMDERSSKMKKSIVAVIAVVSFAGAAFAADVMEFPASMGKVTFNHKKHQEALKDCTKCHASAAGGKIEGFGKDIAHKTCKGCHQEKGQGPTGCKDCHKK
jgi:hypothetical protein